MSRPTSISNNSTVRPPSRRSIAIKCHHSCKNKSRDSAVSGLLRTSTREQLPNDFGEDADQFSTRKDSLGTEELQVSNPPNPPNPIHNELDALEPVPYHYRLQPNFNKAIQTYYPLHQGPRITVSSADGTTLWADAESDSHRNAAAQTLFRALEQKSTNDRRSTLDDHLDKILGTVDLNLEIKHTNSLNSVNLTGNQYEMLSMHGAMEGEDAVDPSDDKEKTGSLHFTIWKNFGKVQKERKQERKWSRWIWKIFGIKWRKEE